MTWPIPQPGPIILYSYLWRHEAEIGKEEGGKSRPCVIILAVRHEENGTRVIVAPVTHRAPTQPGDAIEIPNATKKRLGLDDERSWIIVSEANEFRWPGPDLRVLRANGENFATYGFLPPSLFRAVRNAFLVRAKMRKVVTVPQTE